MIFHQSCIQRSTLWTKTDQADPANATAKRCNRALSILGYRGFLGSPVKSLAQYTNGIMTDLVMCRVWHYCFSMVILLV